MADSFDKRAFMVPDIESYDPAAGPPQNGMDYLRSVIIERRQQPKMFIAEGASVTPKRITVLDHFAALLSTNKAALSAPEGLAPSEDWEAECMSKFQADREVVLPKVEPAGENIMDLLRSLAEGNDEENPTDFGEYEEKPKRKRKNKRKNKRNLNNRPHFDDCVDAPPEEFDFEAELLKFTMELDSAQKPEPENESEALQAENVNEVEGEQGADYTEYSEHTECTEYAEYEITHDTSEQFGVDENMETENTQYEGNEQGNEYTQNQAPSEYKEYSEYNESSNKAEEMMEETVEYTRNALVETEEALTQNEADNTCTDQDIELQELIRKKKAALMQQLSQGEGVEEKSDTTIMTGSKRKRDEEHDQEGNEDENNEIVEADGAVEEEGEGDEEGTRGKKRRRRTKSEGGERHLPHHKDEIAWKVICYGSETKSAETPTLELMQKMDTLTAITLLAYHVNWIGEEDVRGYHATWLYHLLLKVEEPILRDTVADLRELRYKCSVTRSKMETTDQDLNLLNTVITLITKFFKVLDG